MPSAEDYRIVSCRTDLHAFHSTVAVAIGWINSYRRETEMDNERARNRTQILICGCSRLHGRRVASTRIGAWGQDCVRQVGRKNGLKALAPARRGRRRRHRFDPGRTASVQASNWARFCAVVARATHYAQVQETALSIRQEAEPGAERDPPPVFGARLPSALSKRAAGRSGSARRGPSGVARRLGRSGDKPNSLNPAQYKNAYQFLPRLRRQTGFARRRPPGDQTAGYACERHSVIRRCARSKFTPNPITG